MAAVVVTSVAVITDIREFRIPNRLIIVGLIMDAINIIYALVSQGNMLIYLIGMGVGLFMPSVLYVVGALGAGDAKLFMVIGGMIGSSLVIQSILISLVLGGAIGISEMLLSTVKNVGSSCNNRGLCGRRLHGFHFSIGILISVILLTILHI